MPCFGRYLRIEFSTYSACWHFRFIENEGTIEIPIPWDTGIKSDDELVKPEGIQVQAKIRWFLGDKAI